MRSFSFSPFHLQMSLNLHLLTPSLLSYQKYGFAIFFLRVTQTLIRLLSAFLAHLTVLADTGPSPLLPSFQPLSMFIFLTSMSLKNRKKKVKTSFALP